MLDGQDAARQGPGPRRAGLAIVGRGRRLPPEGGRDIATPRWILVVNEGQLELYELLRQSLTADSPVRLLLDRRKGDRRRGNGGPPVIERRRSERRRRQPIGWVYVEPIAPLGPPAVAGATPRGTALVPNAPEIVTAACPTCYAVLKFEMPRFPKPPARLDADVVHVGVGAQIQHYAEIQAFTISGRPLVVQRVQAIRYASS